VLKVPADQAASRPHARSSSSGDIVWRLASELGDACELVEKGSATFTMRPPPPVPDAIAVYERNLARLHTRVAAIDDVQWDAIHHRGQLSSYLRPMGGKVPSIYGPSADDPGGR